MTPEEIIAKINQGRVFCDTCVYRNPIHEIGWDLTFRCLKAKYQNITISRRHSCKDHKSETDAPIQTILVF